MKLIVNIGPDWLGVKYSSKKAAKAALSRLLKSKRPVRKDNLVYKYKGRPYCAAEIEEADVLTLNEFHRAVSV